MRIDLHSHTNFSDGELSPEALIDLAKAQGLDVLALTDHDTIAGIDRAQKQADLVGLKLIVGVELSVRWTNKELHILGLNVDPFNVVLQDGLVLQQAARQKRARLIARDLENAGVPNALEGAKSIAHSDLVARPHFAHYIVQCGRAKDVGDAFKRYLTPGKPGYVETEWVDIAIAIQWIKQAGGIAVIAHPARYKLTMSRLRNLISAFKQAGGEGMEVVTSNHTNDETAIMARLCDEYQLLASMGSDFHGPNSRARLGVMSAMPAGLNPVWEKMAI